MPPMVNPPRGRGGSRSSMLRLVLLATCGVLVGAALASRLLHTSSVSAAAGGTPVRPRFGLPKHYAARGTSEDDAASSSIASTDSVPRLAEARDAAPPPVRVVTPSTVAAGRSPSSSNSKFGITCPPYDANIEALQIPLKHLPRKKKTSVAQKYDRRANNCATNGIWNRVRIQDHHKILHGMVRLGKVQKRSFVLDWGSGCGHSLQFLADEYEVHGVGIDVSNKTIEYARQNTTQRNLHCVADGTRLAWLPSGAFDHVISFGSIYHVYNRTLFCHVLRQLVRVVRVGGTVYNGWTENGEYHRHHVDLCFRDLPAKAHIFEEKTEFQNVEIYPLKAQQDVPNTYSLVVEKTGPMSAAEDERANDLDRIPIECGVHQCGVRGSGIAARDTVKPRSAQPANPNVKDGASPAPTRIEANEPSPAPPAPATAVPMQEADDDGQDTQFNRLVCPVIDQAALDARLQIPLKHLPRKKKTSVAQKYDRRAHNCATEGIWHKVTLEDHERILHVIARFLHLNVPDITVFDWGSGCGHKLRFLRQWHNTRGFGIDVSNKTVTYAIENIEQKEVPAKNRFCVADGTQLEWIPTDTFDRSFSFGSVYHVYNQTLFCHVLREMVRITKPGGRIVNGWTQDSEFSRNDLSACLTEGTWMPHTERNRVRILEDKKEFSGIDTFPLKEHQLVPNTYTLVVEKGIPPAPGEEGR